MLEEKLKELSKDEIGNIYMIGDNPKSDIKGANNNDCISILVRYNTIQSILKHLFNIIVFYCKT